MLLCAARCGLLKTYTHRRLQSFEFVDGCVSSDLGEVATVEVDEHGETPRFRSRYARCVYKRSNVGVDSNALGISVWTTEMSFVVGSDVLPPSIVKAMILRHDRKASGRVLTPPCAILEAHSRGLAYDLDAHGGSTSFGEVLTVECYVDCDP